MKRLCFINNIEFIYVLALYFSCILSIVDLNRTVNINNRFKSTSFGKGDFAMNIVTRIQELCDKKEITITELEREIKIGRGVIRKWEVASPNSDKLQKVADYFGVSTDFLLGREKPTYSNDMDIRRIERARKRMPEKDKEKMMNILKLSFEEYFSDDYEDNDLNE